MSASARQLHAAPAKGVFNVTSGGSLLLSDLLTEPGASTTVLAASVPYAESARNQLIGKSLHNACSVGTARALAMAAWQQAKKLAPDHADLFGFGCTAALATNRPKRGDHRVHLAVQTATTTNTLSFVFDKADTDRLREETRIVELAYLLLQETLGIELTAARDHERLALSIIKSVAKPNWQALYTGELRATADTNSCLLYTSPSPRDRG